jgi:hypothetical protein
MRVKTLLVVVASVLVLSAPMAFGQNLLVNGGFENQDFSGWQHTGDTTFDSVVTGPFYVYSGAQEGNWYAVLGPVGDQGMLAQSFTDVAGGSYTLSFWLNGVGDDPSNFSAFIDGNQVYSATDPNTGGNWTQFTFNFTGTGNDTISFSYRDDPAYIALDNVSVTQNGGTVPEPSSFLLMGSGVLGLAGVIRRKLVG